MPNRHFAVEVFDQGPGTAPGGSRGVRKGGGARNASLLESDRVQEIERLHR